MAKFIRVIPWLDEKVFNNQLSKLEKRQGKIKVDIDDSDINKVTQGINRLNNASNNTNTIFSKLKNTLKDTFSHGKLAMTGYLLALNEINKAGKQAKETIEELDGAVTDLSIAMNGTRREGAEYLKTLNQLAKDLKTSTKSVSDSADTFLRQGKTIAETETLIRDSLVLSKVGKIESAEASDYLTSALNGYKLEAKDAISVIDKLTAVDAVSASEAGGLALSMSRTASAADMAGVSMSKLIGWLAVVKETTRDSDEAVGNMVKSMLSRMNQVRAGKFVDAQTGENLNDMEKVLTKVGIAMRAANGQFISSEKILDELGKRFNEFDSVTQRAVATALGGTYQYEKVITLLSNYSKSLEYTKVAEESAGSSMRKFNESYLNSLEAKQAALQASFESMVINSEFDEVYSGIIEATTALVDFINQTNLLKGALTGLTVSGALKGFTVLKSGIMEAYVSLNQFKQALDITKQANISTQQFDRLLLLTNGLSSSQLKLIVSSKALSLQQKELLLVNSGLSREEAKLQLQLYGLSTAQTGLITSTVSLKSAMSALKSTMLANPFILVTAGISAATMAWNSYKQKLEEMRQATQDATNTYKDSASSIEDYVSKYQDLRQALIAAKGDEQETYNIKQQLLELQIELNNTYGEEYGRLNLLTSAYEDQTEAIKAYNAELAKSYLNENVAGIKDATKQMTKERHYNLSGIMYQGSVEADALREIADKYSSISILDGTDGTFTVHINADAQSANETINSFMDDLREKAKELGNENLFDDVFTYSSAELNRSQKILDEFADTYKQSLMAEIVTDDGRAEIYNQALQAVEQYNDAVAKSENPYDDGNVSKARRNLESIKEEIQNNIDEWGKYSAVTDDLFNQADTRLIDFNNELKSNKDLLADMDSLSGYSDVDLKAFNPGDNGAFDRLKKSAEEYDLSVNELIETLRQFGIIQDVVESNGESAYQESILSISSTIDQLNTQLKPAMDSLESAWNNIFTDDGFTLENIDLSTFESIKSKLDEMAELGLEVDTSSFENFVTVLNDTDSTAEQVKDAFDGLATSIVDAGVSGIEDFQLLKDTLQEMGVQNFEMVALEELVKNTEALKAAGLDLVNATDVQIQAFVEEMVSAENTAQAYNLLLYAKELCSLQDMNTAGEVANLKTLAENAGITGNVIIWLTELEQIYQEIASGLLDPSNPMAINGKLIRAAMLKGLIDGAATEIKFSGNEVDYKPLTKAAGKAGKDAGKSYKDKLKDELSGLGDVLNYINDIIGDQIDLLGDQKDAAVDALNAEKEAAEAALQAQIDLLEAQIEGIEAQIEAKEKEIEAIEEARKQRELDIAAQKAQYNLARMQSQRTRLIYKGEPGQMVYETDTQGIRDAREEYDKAQENLKINQIEKEISLLEDEISNLEDVIDSLNDQIEASNKYYEDLIKSTENYYDGLIKNLEDYQNRWKEIGEIEEQAKIQVKLKELGITAEDVLNMSEDAFNSFKQQYLSILTEMYSGEQDMIQAINDVANGIDVTTLTEGLNQTKENIDNLNEADFNSVSTGLNDISDGMGNVGTSASSASEGTSSVSSDLQEMNTNAEGLDTKLSNISSALNGIPNSERFDELTNSFTNLGTAIQSVADALGISGEDSVSGLVTALTELGSFSLSGEKGEGGIIEQFQNLKSAVYDVTSAINGGGSTGESASATNASGARTGSSMGTGNSTTGGGSGLTGAIKEIGTTTDETIGSGGEGEGTGGKESEGEGVLGKFGQFKSAVEEVTKAIGTGEEESGEEGATSLISALQLHYEKAGETLPEVKNMFEELLAKILECVSALGELAGAMSSLGGEGFAFGTVGTGFSSGTDPKASFTTTVGKAFAKGTGKYKGLPKDEKNALRSEYGQPELTVYPDGTTELTTEPTMSDLPKDTVIFNEEQTKRIMSNKGTVIGNAYAEGNASVEKSSRFDNMRDLQPGDRMYDLLQKWNAYFEKNDHSFIEPVNAIQKNTEEIARSVSNVNTNNIQRSVNIGDINITCPGVTSNEVAAQVSTELHKQIGGIALEVLQESHITR